VVHLDMNSVKATENTRTTESTFPTDFNSDLRTMSA